MGVPAGDIWSTIRDRDLGRTDRLCILLPRWDFGPRNDELSTFLHVIHRQVMSPVLYEKKVYKKLILIDPWMHSLFYELAGHVVPICTYPPTSTIR